MSDFRLENYDLQDLQITKYPCYDVHYSSYDVRSLADHCWRVPFQQVLEDSSSVDYINSINKINLLSLILVGISKLMRFILVMNLKWNFNRVLKHVRTSEWHHVIGKHASENVCRLILAQVQSFRFVYATGRCIHDDCNKLLYLWYQCSCSRALKWPHSSREKIMMLWYLWKTWKYSKPVHLFGEIPLVLIRWNTFRWETDTAYFYV